MKCSVTYETHRLVVDEDGGVPCALFDLDADPCEDDNIVESAEARPVVDEIMETTVLPFLSKAPVRPHESPFTGG